MAGPSIHPVLSFDAVIWVLMRDATTDAPIAGRTLLVEAPEDQGAFITYSTFVFDAGNGWYRIGFGDISWAATSDPNSRLLPLKITAAGAKDNNDVMLDLGVFPQLVPTPVDNAAAVMGWILDDAGTTLVQALRGFIAALLGKTDHLGGLRRFFNRSGNKVVISADTTSDGDRTDVALDLS